VTQSLKKPDRAEAFAVAVLLVLIGSALGSVPARAADPFAEKIVRIVAPGATSLAISDNVSVLAIGQGGAKPSLALLPLDAAGQPAKAPPLPIELPKPASLAETAVYPLGVCFHPALPRLYVWRDAAVPNADKKLREAAHRDFAHLVVLDLTGGSAKPLGQFAQGPEFACAQPEGAVGTDPEARRIFLPNMRNPETGAAAIGYYDLDAQGLPKPGPVPIEGSLDGRGLNLFKMEVRPVRIDVDAYRGLPTGWGFFAPTPDVVIFGGSQGLALWDTTNRRGALSQFTIHQTSSDCRIGGHKAFGYVYGAGKDHCSVFAMAHVNGFLTMLPQIVNASAARCQSAPVVILGQPNRLAVGGENCLYLFTLDREGRFAGPNNYSVVPVPETKVRAIAYSEKFGRLYVAVEKLE